MQRRWELRKWAANKTKQVNVQMTTPETNDEKSSATNNSTSITKQSYYYKGWFKFAKRFKHKIWSYPKACDKIKIKNKL